ncbi:Tyrosine decarboxylase 1 [Vitis vinifera]|uniref:Tyrosine decarboxylase 1 n=1 Tax=Vitis vinifera TaxID=29760 RepID=A0A438KDU7_VITVI|nr:Tyrosine decarboxylase 1 [Vitis vinifera]
MDAEQLRENGHKMVDFIADYYKSIENFPVLSQVEPGYLRELLPDSAPNQPESLQQVFDDLQAKILPGVTHWQSPNFFAYYPSNSSTAGFLGEMLSAGLNIVGFSWITSPAATELEMIVLDWLAKMLNLPDDFLSAEGGVMLKGYKDVLEYHLVKWVNLPLPEVDRDPNRGNGGGVIQGTASEAVLVVLLAARDRVLRTVGKTALEKLVVYGSDQTHSALQKACQEGSIFMAHVKTIFPTYKLSHSMEGMQQKGINPETHLKIGGIHPENCRLLKADSSTGYALSPDLLSEAVSHDIANGLIPFFLCANVGTTSSTAVDPLLELGKVTKSNGIWFHVDAAYAGSAVVCPEYRHYIDGVEEADSFNMNAHKWFLTNFDCSVLWVKYGLTLLKEHDILIESVFFDIAGVLVFWEDSWWGDVPQPLAFSENLNFCFSCSRPLSVIPSSESDISHNLTD